MKIFFFFFLESTCACVLGPWPWPRAFLSLASRVSVLGKAVLGLDLASDFFCVLGLGLEPCVLNSTSGERLRKTMMSRYQSIWRGRRVCNLSPTTNRKIKIVHYRKTKIKKFLRSQIIILLFIDRIKFGRATVSASFVKPIKNNEKRLQLISLQKLPKRVDSKTLLGHFAVSFCIEC